MLVESKQQCGAGQDVDPLHGIRRQVDAARQAQQGWQATTFRQRRRVLRRFRHELVESPDRLTALVKFEGRTNRAETLAAETIPLADACLYLEKHARRILRPTRPFGRAPIWCRDASVVCHREPFGVVLIVAPGNYPLYLMGVQCLQAIAAGNAVLIKPAVAAGDLTRQFVAMLESAGAPPGLVAALPEDVAAVTQSLASGVDKVVFTGSAETGMIVQRELASNSTPSTMELSGCDAVFVLESADLNRVAKCLAFGLRLNGSRTCIAPRRVFVPRGMMTPLEDSLRAAIQPISSHGHFDSSTQQLISQAIADGARPLTEDATSSDLGSGPLVLCDVDTDTPLLKSDVFAPILSLIAVDSAAEALNRDNMCPYALGASVFGNASEATSFANSINAGCVVINDLIAPTADPRVPFGGRQASGFGVTRGAEGLLDMTQLKAVITRRGSWLPHLDPPDDTDEALLMGLLTAAHGKTWPRRWSGITQLIAAVRQKSRRNGDN